MEGCRNGGKFFLTEVGFHGIGIKEDTHEFQGGRCRECFPGAIGIFKSVNRCKTLHKAVIQLALGGGATRKKSSKM